MAVSDDEVDDLLYFARTGDLAEFESLKKELCAREKFGMPEILQLAIDKKSGNGVFHMSAANGHTYMLNYLCKELSNSSPHNSNMLSILNTQNTAGNTALHWAVLNEHLHSVKVLMEQGADPTIVNHRGHDTIYEAELNGRAWLVEWILKEGGERLEKGLGEESGNQENKIENRLERVNDQMHEMDINDPKMAS